MESSKNKPSPPDDDDFSYHGYQVVRREFFSHVHEPSITFSNCKVWLNAACLIQMPDVDYVQILVNPQDKKLAVRPSSCLLYTSYAVKAIADNR